MDLSLLLKGLAVGFTVAAPLGPIGLLCIGRTLSNGLSSGLATGLGAATADAIYGCIGGLGVTFLAQALTGRQWWFRLIGGLFLVYLGMRICHSKPAASERSADVRALTASYGSAFLLTLANPVTIVSFSAIFATFGVGDSKGSYSDAVTLLAGIVCGSAAWWLILSVSVNWFRRRIRLSSLGWINKVVGAIIAGCGFVALATISV